MKNKIQKYLSGEREGFSLVELIIVIAIMAILIGVIALAVLPYLEKSRVGKDQQTVDTVYSAFQATVAEQKLTADATVSIPNGAAASGPSDAFLTSMAKALNANSKTDMHSSTADKLESTDAKEGTIVCKYDAGTGEISVQVQKKNSTEFVSGIKSSNKK